MKPDWADLLILDTVARTFPGQVRAIRVGYHAPTDSFRVAVALKPQAGHQVRITITAQALADQ